ncbi:uncharacterized protein BDZ83DRAFT_751172 [Colletotrichum acutatum]|uniref:Uncharacterized protein n=1 Tax=Glomerella acutata TaxID=27357 RepID=A0AAD8XH62_GLOAC|nr:uncharacterized protein BDZ83DRAFT_751172 [Colletotrichum acutatum]KAK1726136.1 hypothetical protein BDZ83DRAFT_751172 [Colletotrichum acutatum]
MASFNEQPALCLLRLCAVVAGVVVVVVGYKYGYTGERNKPRKPGSNRGIPGLWRHEASRLLDESVVGSIRSIDWRRQSRSNVAEASFDAAVKVSARDDRQKII